jgi:Na+-translocating ferredoxin:NAD+ oxidoreductase subunit B
MATPDEIDALLPQTQCTRCGYSGCSPYANAIALGEAEINQCPPGGARTIERLAALTNRAVIALNPTNGIETVPCVAVIDESRCIGCAKCLPPCPVDAIVGAGRYMHTVLADLCTGCELCVAPCPVDCITLVPRAAAAGITRHEPTPAENRTRFAAHNSRIARRAADRAALLVAKKQQARAP